MLGAGASKPYGLPLGAELRAMICAAEDVDRNPAAQAVANAGPFSAADVKDVARAFRRSNVRSIDEFLGRMPHLADVGKALIAANLCQLESAENLFREDNADHWYRLVWNAMVDDTNIGGEPRQNSVRFITFNYDRSLECFLHEATRNTYGGTDGAAFGNWSPLPILHVYGSLGHFSFADPARAPRPYNPKIRPREIPVAAGGIHIMREDRDGSGVFEEARKWFDWASHVYVLGFGFDRLNCERLDFPAVAQFNKDRGRGAPRVVASAFGLTAAEIKKAQSMMCAGFTARWQAFDATSTMTLRQAGLPD